MLRTRLNPDGSTFTEAAAMSSDEEMPLFRHFTRESLAATEARIAERHQQRLKAEAEVGSTRDRRDEAPDPALEAGMPLPRRLARLFPQELTGEPLEDIDKYYRNEKTFMIVSKGKDIFRFSATNSMWILSPFNPLRAVAICIHVHPAFSFLLMAAILVQSVLMAMPSNESIESSQIIFTIIYTVELCIKVVARGFVLEKFTYLRDPWNWLDFIVIVSEYVTMVLDLGNLSALRTFRVLRALKTVAIPGLQTIVGALIESVKNLKDIILLTLFSLSVFALFGLQMYMGVLTQICVRNPDPDLNLTMDEYVKNYSAIESNWILEDDQPILCGNAYGARQCPSMSTCVQGVGKNPDYGYTSFDSFPWALLSAFRLMTQDFWESVYHMVLKSAGPWHAIFFVVIIFLGSFNFLNLILAIVAMSYDKLQRKVEEEEAMAAEEAALQAAADADAPAADALEAANRLESQDSYDYMSPKKESDNQFSDFNRQTVVNIKGKEEVDKPRPKERCLKCIDFFCVWDCCKCWVKFQEIVGLIVFDPFVELFITLCILLTTLFLAMFHHDMEVEYWTFLNNGIFFFTVTFAIEAAFKIVALGPKYYFCEGWNILDFIVVAIALLQSGLEGGRVPIVLLMRSFRLLRVFKLAKCWHTLNLLISIMGRALGALGNLTFVLGIVVYIFAILGMQLFGKYYDEKKYLFTNEEIPIYHFKDFTHSFMVVFRALCGEWIETMWDCWLVAGWTCIPYFLSVVVIGNFVVLNLFIALLLSSFGPSCLCVHPPLTADTQRLQEAIDRFSRAGNWVKKFLLQGLNSNRSKLTNQTPDQKSEMMLEEMPEAPLTGKFAADGQGTGMENFSKNHADLEVVVTDDTETAAIQDAIEGRSDCELNTDKYDVEMADHPPDCCSDCCYVRFPVCRGDESAFWKKWDEARRRSFVLVEHKYFEAVIITIILISSLALAAEDVNLKDRPLLKEILQHMDKVFIVLFLFEMLLKWFAFGLKRYFTNAWCWLEFVIVLVSMFNLAAELDGYGAIPFFKTMRILRVLYVLRGLSRRIEGMRVIANTLVRAIPAIFSALLVCLMFWLIFAIMGVHLMGGKFYYCTDFEKGIRVNLPGKEDCAARNLTWTNPQINFDNVLNAYLALFQVATFKGWIDIIKHAMDMTDVDEQPKHESSMYMYLYFVFFIIFVSFFTLNLFIGVIIDIYNEQKRKVGGSLEMFMTEDQKIYYHAMKKMHSKKPAKAIPRPQFKLQAMVFDLTTNKKFEIAIMILICLNMMVMAMDHYNLTESFATILERLNVFFIAIYIVECVLKIFALRIYYFKEPLNVFDFVVVTLSVLGIVLKDSVAKYYVVPPLLLRVVRLLKAGRLLRPVRGARGLRTHLRALSMSLPALLYVCLIFFLVTAVYAVFGMSFFQNVRHRAGVNQNFNFETFGQSFMLLLPVLTMAGWDGVLVATGEQNDCYGEDCGNWTVAVLYLVSYVIVSFLVIKNVYVAVVVYNYGQATDDAELGLTEDDSDMFHEVWGNYDPEGTQYIGHSDLGTFLDQLEEPLRIPLPNKYKVVSMDIPICEGEKLFYADVLEAVTKDFLRRRRGGNIDGLEWLPRPSSRGLGGATKAAE